MRKYSFLIIAVCLPLFAQDVQPPAPQIAAPEAEPDQRVDLILGQRDPFSPPKYIRDLEYEHLRDQSKNLRPEDMIDLQMEAIRRWPLAEYKLLAVIWDVKNPKAMVLDKSNTMHLLKKNYRIGNREGVISEINESEIVVLQKGVPVVVQIYKPGPDQNSKSSAQSSTQLNTQPSDKK